jgi:hypothetical protein
VKFAVLNLIILILLITVKASPTWGFSVSRADDYLKRAQEINLAQDPKWLKFGHYNKTLFGYASDFRGPLFLHVDGHKSPELELQETIKSFFSKDYTPRHKYEHEPQCQFLARRNWLVKKLNVAQEDILKCEKREEWKKNLSATSVSLIFASADLGNPASSFGHTFIKLINPANSQNKDLIDYGVNFAANANESDFMYAARGLFGLYGGIYTMLPYHQKIREYINLEGRDIVEYQLNLNPEQVDELVNHLLELERSEAPYYFFTTNCSYQLLTLFELINPSWDLSDDFFFWVIPIDTVKKVHGIDGLVVSRKHKKSLNTEYLEGYSQLGFLQKRALDEAVAKLKISEDFELDKKEKALVYETAARYYAVKGYRTGEDVDKQVYDLSVERAQLGLIQEDKKVEKIFAPENSHDSSALYLGAGNLQDRAYGLIKFRSAFHDLEQNDMGQVPMSLTNVGMLEARYYNDIQKWTVAKLTLMHLINTTPVTQLDKNFSWKARIEVLDQWRPDVEYAVGYSFDLALGFRSRISSFISARYFKDFSKHTYQAGPELLFTSYPFENLGFSAALTYFAEHENTPYLRFNTKFNYQIKRNWDLQLQGNDQRDYQSSLVYNFIF